MKELVEKVAALYADFSKDANAQLENGNKAAGTRARKASLEIEKAMKDSVKHLWKLLRSKKKSISYAVKDCHVWRSFLFLKVLLLLLAQVLWMKTFSIN